MQSLSSQAHTQRSRRKGDNKVKVTSRARYFNLLLRQLRSPCTRSSSQRSLPAFHLHFHQCSSLNIEDVTELKGRRAWKDSPKPLQKTPLHLVVTELTTQPENNSQGPGSLQWHWPLHRYTKEKEGNLFSITSSALTAKKSLPYSSWGSSPGSLYVVLFFVLQVVFHLVIKFLTFYIAQMNLSCLHYCLALW